MPQYDPDRKWHLELSEEQVFTVIDCLTDCLSYLKGDMEMRRMQMPLSLAPDSVRGEMTAKVADLLAGIKRGVSLNYPSDGPVCRPKTDGLAGRRSGDSAFYFARYY